MTERAVPSARPEDRGGRMAGADERPDAPSAQAATDAHTGDAAAADATLVPRKGRRRTVAGRLLASYLVLLLAFAATVGWSFFALRDAARDADLLRAAYVPLLESIGEALSGQNVMSTQLNHITAAKNPADVRQWIETARRLRPATFRRIRDHARQSLGGSALGEFVAREAEGVAQLLADDGGRFEQLFRALAGSGPRAAERLRDELLAQETEGAVRLRSLRQRVEEEMEALIQAARRREGRSVLWLVGLSVLTLAVGILVSLYARRVLRPLERVTARAAAVTRGDLRPQPPLATDDEIGELATTFESMVAAIRTARSELVQAERLATIGRMAAHVTHEVRNPLSSMSLNLELLEEELAAPEGHAEAAALVAAIKAEVERLSRVAEQYLAAARTPRLELEPQSVEEVVGACMRFVEPELLQAGVRPLVVVDPDLPRVPMDAARIRQALLNLVRNAREAMPQGGALALRVERTATGVSLAVEDEGAGIPEEDRRTVFDPFYTTKERGTGLGLAVTRAIVDAHGGAIRCEARAEGGTRFVIELPGANHTAAG